MNEFLLVYHEVNKNNPKCMPLEEMAAYLKKKSRKIHNIIKNNK